MSQTTDFEVEEIERPDGLAEESGLSPSPLESSLEM